MAGSGLLAHALCGSGSTVQTACIAYWSVGLFYEFAHYVVHTRCAHLLPLALLLCY